MGKQINFYMYGDDEREFIAAARERTEVLVFPYRSVTEQFESLTTLPEKGQLFGGSVWLWSPAKCAPPIVQWVAQQHAYYIDRLASEVIEFSRSFLDDGALVRARIWAEMAGSDPRDPEKMFRKSPSFEKWFDSLVHWIKKNYEKLEGPLPEYVGPAAAKFKHEGGALKPVAIAQTVKLVRH